MKKVNIEIRYGKTLDPSKSVKVYRNLHNSKLSIVQNGIVVAYTDEIYMKYVKFYVQKAGLRKVRETKQKNVHAYVKGIICEECDFYGMTIKYNPYLYDTFVNDKGEMVSELNLIYIDNNGKMKGE